MKKVFKILFLAPSSIPTNNPEAICNVKVLNALLSCGIDIKIDLICKIHQNISYQSDDNSELISLLDRFIPVKVENKITLRSIWGHLCILLKTGYVYKGAHWAYYAIRCAEKLLCTNQYDFIMSRNPASELAALYLSRKYNIPWLANWNDPYPEKRMPMPYGAGPYGKLTFWESHLMKKVAAFADYHTFSSSRQMEYMLLYMNIPKERRMVIPHIVDRQMFPSRRCVQRHKKIRMIHSGNISAPRDPDLFLDAIQKLNSKKSLDHILEVIFVGKTAADLSRKIKHRSLEHIITIVPSMPYMDNLKFIQSCDIALLLEAASDNSVFLPTKVVDYMQCHIPIFSISSINGTLHDMYLDDEISYFADVSNCDSIQVELNHILDDYKMNTNFGQSVRIPVRFTKEKVLEQYISIFKHIGKK